MDYVGNIGKDNTTSAENQIIFEEACQRLKSMAGYPYDRDKDLPFIMELLLEFPSLDLPDEIRQWTIWMLDNLDRVKQKRVNYRARLRRWCQNASQWKKEKDTRGEKRPSAPGRTGNSGKFGKPRYKFEDSDDTRPDEPVVKEGW